MPIPTPRKNASVIVKRVDSRDQQWEDNDPVFHVYFWRELGGGAFHQDEYELSGADVNEVLVWANEERDGRTFTLYLQRDDLSGRGLVLLAGIDPTANPMSC